MISIPPESPLHNLMRPFLQRHVTPSEDVSMALGDCQVSRDQLFSLCTWNGDSLRRNGTKLCVLGAIQAGASPTGKLVTWECASYPGWPGSSYVVEEFPFSPRCVFFLHSYLPTGKRRFIGKTIEQTCEVIKLQEWCVELIPVLTQVPYPTPVWLYVARRKSGES